MKIDQVLDPEATYGYTMDDNHIMSLIRLARKGIAYQLFRRFVGNFPFSLQEWSSYLHISERTLQRYSKENRTFDAGQSEKILEIALLFKKGIAVFGSKEKFDTWLTTNNLALGGIMPKSLLDSSFGIRLLDDELTRIEQGILA